MTELDPKTVERLRKRSPAEILGTVKQVAYASGGGSDQYLELLEEAVRTGLLTWEEIETIEES